MGLFSKTFVRLRVESGFTPPYAFYHRNGGRHVFPFTFPYYLKLERGEHLPRPEWLPDPPRLCYNRFLRARPNWRHGGGMKNVLSLLLISAVGASAAVSPDLSVGIAAARSIVLQDGKPVRLASTQQRELLLALLRDPDAGVRKAALKSLRGYVGQTIAARNAVLAVYWNAAEEVEVRAEAAKTLALVSTYNEVYERLLSYAERGPVESLRVISAKALYQQAAARSDVRHRLERLLLNAPSAEVRAAAAWGLFAASGNPSTRDALVRASGRDASNAVRVEAIKSLYGAMGHSSIRYDAVRLALNASAPAELRKPAILLLSWGGDHQTRQALERLVRTEKDPDLRAAAVTALNPSDESIARYFHLARRTHNGALLDPLENE